MDRKQSGLNVPLDLVRSCGNSREIDLKNYISGHLSKSIDPLQFYGLVLRTLRVALINEGIDVDPIQHEAGVKMGEVLYEEVKDRDTAMLLGNIAGFWEAHKLGSVKVERLEPLTIVVQGCYECGDLPYLGRPACSFDAGILKAIFSAHFKGDYAATETNCYAMGDDYCRFVIDEQ
jgi:predicted hydrocarbon binding protein